MTEPNRTLEAFAEIVARVRSVQREQVARLPELRDPAVCPERFLDWLGATRGLSPDLPLAAQLTEEDWRRLIPSLGPLWSTKGAQESVRDVVRATVGQRVWIGDWLRIRFVTPGSPPLFLTEAPPGGIYLTELHIEDPGTAALRTKIVDSLRLVRPVKEEFRINFAHFVENWLYGPSRWDGASGTTSIAPPAGEPDDTSILIVGPNAGVASVRQLVIDPAIPVTWDHVHYVGEVRVNNVGTFRIRDDGLGDNYEIELTAGAPPATTVRLLRAGVPVATAVHPVGDDEDTLLRVMTMPGAGPSLGIDVEINGELAISYVDGAPLAPGARGVSWRVAVGTDIMTVLWFNILPGVPVQATLP